MSQHNTVKTQQCHNTTVSQHNTVTTQNVWFFQERLLKVLKCYSFLWVQQRHNCCPAASFANCVMTLYLFKVHLQTFLSIKITQKCQILSCDTHVANERYVGRKRQMLILLRSVVTVYVRVCVCRSAVWPSWDDSLPCRCVATVSPLCLSVCRNVSRKYNIWTIYKYR